MFSKTSYQVISNPNVVEPRTPGPPYEEDPGIMNNILQPSIRKMYGKAPQYNELPL